jgi:integrase/recombinase XerD
MAERFGEREGPWGGRAPPVGRGRAAAMQPRGLPVRAPAGTQAAAPRRPGRPAPLWTALPAPSAIKGFFRFAVIDGLIERNPAEHANVPKVQNNESRLLGLDRLELGNFIATARDLSPQHSALAHLLSFLGLRVSEACAVQIEDFADTERGHRVLHLVGKGNKPATMPLTAPVIGAMELAQGERTAGPLLVKRKDGTQLDRNAAAAMVATICRHAGITKQISPLSLRHSMITNALDAGVPLRDVQITARHADPRTTVGYDRARENLDRHAIHALSDYLTGAC